MWEKNESLGIKVRWFIVLTELPWEYFVLSETNFEDYSYRGMFDDDPHQLVDGHHHVAHLILGDYTYKHSNI